MTCVHKEPDGRCCKPDIAFCIGGACAEREMSNADRIRSMSDESLASFLSNIELEAYKRDGKTANSILFFKQWKDWLKSPAERKEE